MATALMVVGGLLLAAGVILGLLADSDGSALAAVELFQIATVGAVLLVGGIITRVLERLPGAQIAAHGAAERERLAAEREREIASEARPEK